MRVSWINKLYDRLIEMKPCGRNTYVENPERRACLINIYSTTASKEVH